MSNISFICLFLYNIYYKTNQPRINILFIILIFYLIEIKSSLWTFRIFKLNLFIKSQHVMFSKFIQLLKYRLIKKLKFQNLIYEAGDNIRIRSDILS